MPEQDPIDPISPPYYSRNGVEVIDFIEAFELNFVEGAIVKYLARWRRKNGVEDLRKARFYLDRLIAHAEGQDAAGS